MQLYFAPLTCSLACRIALYEAGADFEAIEVDRMTKQIVGGGDYRQVHPIGTVPALRRDDGRILTENAAILLHIADAFPDAGLVLAAERDEARQWLSFVGSEIHKGVFYPHFDPTSDEVVKVYARSRARARFPHVERHLAEHDFLLSDFSVADCYLFTTLQWTVATPIELSDWPVLAAYHARLSKRPSIARAVADELPLYRAQQARRETARAN